MEFVLSPAHAVMFVRLSENLCAIIRPEILVSVMSENHNA